MTHTPCSTSPNHSATSYIGRFAPSPSGPLHFGSLVSALASYLDAKAHNGQWLVRMEDLDPPREQAGAAALILQSLEDHGLEWDAEVIYQSHRHNAYQSCLELLHSRAWIYPCSCSRQRLQSLKGIYDGHCRSQTPAPLEPHSLRLKLYDLPNTTAGTSQRDEITFQDLFQGQQQQNLRLQAGDQILKRRDGFYAYQLAVVVDDIFQGITHIVRGNDLLDVTGRQLFLFQLLDAPLPHFGHIPLALQENGQKLSKQNQAPALDSRIAGINLWHALRFLGQNPPSDLLGCAPSELLCWGQAHWQRANIKGLGQHYPAAINPASP
jgi:glutamyl-Q tRNA(Asp) synthetase